MRSSHTSICDDTISNGLVVRAKVYRLYLLQLRVVNKIIMKSNFVWVTQKLVQMMHEGDVLVSLTPLVAHFEQIQSH